MTAMPFLGGRTVRIRVTVPLAGSREQVSHPRSGALTRRARIPIIRVQMSSTIDALADFSVEDHVGFLLRRAHQRHVALFTAGVAHAELTPTQFTALLKTVQLGRITQNHLGRLAAMDPATIQGVVQRLIGVV